MKCLRFTKKFSQVALVLMSSMWKTLGSIGQTIQQALDEPLPLNQPNNSNSSPQRSKSIVTSENNADSADIAQFSQLQANYTRALQENASLRQQLQTAQSSTSMQPPSATGNTQLQQQNEQLLNDLNNLKQKAKVRISQMQQQIDELTAQLQRKQSQPNIIQNQPNGNNYAEQLAQAMERIRQLENATATAAAAIPSDAAGARVAELEGLLMKAKDVIRGKMAEIENLQTALNAHSSKNSAQSDLQVVIEDLQKVNAELSIQNEKFQQQFQVLNGQLEEKSLMIQKFEHELHQSKKEIELLLAHRQIEDISPQLQKQLDVANQQILNFESDKKNLSEQIRYLQTIIVRMEEQAKMSSESTAILHRDMDAKTQELMELSRQCQELRVQVQSNAKIAAELNALVQNWTEIKDHVASLESGKINDGKDIHQLFLILSHKLKENQDVSAKQFKDMASLKSLLAERDTALQQMTTHMDEMKKQHMTSLAILQKQLEQGQSIVAQSKASVDAEVEKNKILAEQLRKMKFEAVELQKLAKTPPVSSNSQSSESLQNQITELNARVHMYETQKLPVLTAENDNLKKSLAMLQQQLQTSPRPDQNNLEWMLKAELSKLRDENDRLKRASVQRPPHSADPFFHEYDDSAIDTSKRNMVDSVAAKASSGYARFVSWYMNNPSIKMSMSMKRAALRWTVLLYIVGIHVIALLFIFKK